MTTTILSSFFEPEEAYIVELMTDNDIDRETAEQWANEAEQESVRDSLNEILDSLDYPIFLIGKMQVWNGKFRAYDRFENADELRMRIAGYDEFKITKEDRSYHIYLYHHDGTHDFSIYQLSKKGEQYEDTHPNDEVNTNSIKYFKNVSIA